MAARLTHLLLRLEVQPLVRERREEDTPSRRQYAATRLEEKVTSEKERLDLLSDLHPCDGTHHALVQEHNTNGLRHDRVDLAAPEDIGLHLLVLDHAAHDAHLAAHVGVGFSAVGLVDELASVRAL